MTITRHDHIGLSLNRTLQDAIVIWVVTDDIERGARNDDLSYLAQQL